MSAFAHKGGVHVAAVLKDAATYEHVNPEAVGNRQRVLVSDLSGRGNVLYKLRQHGLADRLTEEARRDLLERIKEMEYLGYELEAAEGTFELLVRQALRPGAHLFRSRRLRSRAAIHTLRRHARDGHRQRHRAGRRALRHGIRQRPAACPRYLSSQMSLVAVSSDRAMSG